jgi:hypothetical protein
MSPQTKTDISNWPTKPEVARILNCAEKTVERLVSRGKLEQRFRESEDGRRSLGVYNPEHVERQRAETEVRAVLLPEPGKSPNPAALGAFLDAIKPVPPSTATPPQIKGWLTLEEAEEYWGLPQSYLQDAIREKRLIVIRRTRWLRINRVSLERLT